LIEESERESERASERAREREREGAVNIQMLIKCFSFDALPLGGILEWPITLLLEIQQCHSVQLAFVFFILFLK